MPGAALEPGHTSQSVRRAFDGRAISRPCPAVIRPVCALHLPASGSAPRQGWPAAELWPLLGCLPLNFGGSGTTCCARLPGKWGSQAAPRAVVRSTLDRGGFQGSVGGVSRYIGV